MDALLRPDTARALGAAGADGDELRRHRLEAKLGYGFALFGGRYTGTPELGLGLTDTHCETILAWRLAEARRSGAVFSLDIEGTREERTAGDAEPGHRIGFGFGWRLEGARDVAYEVRFEGSRHEPANDDAAPEHRIGLRTTARW